MDLTLRSREPEQIPQITTSLSVNPIEGEPTDPSTYSLNNGEGTDAEEREWRQSNFDVTYEGDKNGLKVTEINKKTGEVRIVECPTVINIAQVRSAFTKSNVNAATAGLTSPWRELDKIIPVQLSGSHPLPPPQSRPITDLEPTD